MLKILKWAYNLGVDQERQRIASYLQLSSQQAYLERETALDMFRENGDKFSKSRSQKLEFSIAVNNRIREIIEETFKSHNDVWIPGSSFMFPEEKGKKEK